jgi:hypothetical protein
MLDTPPKISILAISLTQTVQAEWWLFHVGGYHTCTHLNKTKDLIFGKKLDQRILQQVFNQLHTA